MTERVVLLEPTKETTESGAQRTVWKRHRERWAQWRHKSSYGEINAAELFGAQKSEFIMRDNVMPLRGWRLEHRGGFTYELVADAVRDRRLGMITLTCQRVNE